MRDRSKKLLVINTGKKESEQTRLPAQSGTTHIIGGGGMSVNMADYLLKSIWDKVFEIRTDSQGTEYIFGKLPVVTQYGITMYSGDGVNVPSLASGLPFDGRTIWYNPDTQQIEVIGGTGGGSGEGVSNFWDLSGIPSWITNSKPKYTYSEIEGTPDLTKYATESWVNTKLGGYLPLNGNASSATKLQTARTIWGQSFDGTGNVSGNVKGSYFTIGDRDNAYIELLGGANYGYVQILADGSMAVGSNTSKAIIVSQSGNVGIGTTSPISKCDINGLLSIRLESSTSKQSSLNLMNTSSDLWQLSARYGSTEDGNFNIYYYDGSTWAKPISINKNGNLLATGGITTNDSVTINGIKLSKSKDGVLYLDGNLVVKGGVTMYGTDATSSPSILDSLPIASTSTKGIAQFNPSDFAVKDGVVSFVGSVDGGVASSVAWGNITGKPTWIGSSKPTYSYSEITGAISTTELQNYLTQNSYLNVTSGDNRYLKLSGGTLSSKLHFYDTNNYIQYTSNYFEMYNAKGQVGIGLYNDGTLKKIGGTSGIIWHSGNDGSGSGLDADLLDGQNGNWYQQSVLGFARYNYTNNTASERDANAVTDGMLYNFGSTNYWKNTPSGLSYGQILSLSSANDTALMGQLAWDINHTSTSDTTRTLWWRGIRNKDNISYAKWHQIAFTDSNVASATKLQTARTIWGQSFDGTGNVSGNVKGSYFTIGDRDNAYIELLGGANYGYVQILADGSMAVGSSTSSSIIVNKNGNVGIGITQPSVKLQVKGSSGWTSSIESSNSISYLSHNNGHGIYIGSKSSSVDVTLLELWYGQTNLGGGGNCALMVKNNGSVGIGTTSPNSPLHVVGDISTYTPSGTYNVSVNFANSTNDRWQISGRFNKNSSTENNRLNTYYYNGSTWANIMSLFTSGDMLVSGGITMYSDQRKKTILNNVELSLKQIAEAPLIEHYYNSDEKKTTHVGSIAQYWASINDWFCKLDSEGFYTMEIQNAALASAISIARELDRYETKTDKAIKKLKKRICELEEEVERLKSA